MDHAEIQTIRTQYQAGQWPQLLETITLSGLRGWTGQTVSFPFPVTAIVGENGTGKSTILKCAACGYENADRSKRFFLHPSLWKRIGIRFQVLQSTTALS